MNDKQDESVDTGSEGRLTFSQIALSGAAYTVCIVFAFAVLSIASVIIGNSFAP